MNVKFLSIGTLMEGLAIRDLGPTKDIESTSWRVDTSSELRSFKITSTNGEGMLIAGAFEIRQSESSPNDPSDFFMID